MVLAEGEGRCWRRVVVGFFLYTPEQLEKIEVALRIVAGAQQAEAEAAQTAEESTGKRPVTDAFARGRGI